MTQKPKDFNAYFDFQKRAMAPFLDLNEFAVRTFERAARHGYEAAGEALEFSIAQAKAALTAKDPQQFAAKQAQLATEFVGTSISSTVNAAYLPSDEELARAERIVAAFKQAEARGEAAVQVDGQMVDYPVAFRAQALLDGARRN